VGEKEGVEVVFKKVNAEGGIDGRKLKLIALDDYYDPIRAGKNVRELVNKDHIFAFLGNMGSATSLVTLPIILNNKILLFAPVTGNEIYRKNPPDHYVFNLRASLREEVDSLIQIALSKGVKPNEFALFIQNDSFGNAVYDGAIKAFKKLGYPNPEDLPVGRFNRMTVNVEDALATIIPEQKVKIKAFILGGNFVSNANFIKLAKQEFPDAIFLSVSGRIDPSNLDKKDEKNIIVTQLVPYYNADLPGIKQYRDDLTKYANGIKPSFENLEGYLSAKIFVMVLKKAAIKNNLTTEGVIDALESMQHIDLGINQDIMFNKYHHNGLNITWPMVIENKQFIPFKK